VRWVLPGVFAAGRPLRVRHEDPVAHIAEVRRSVLGALDADTLVKLREQSSPEL
jgi:hypothetical protein